MAQPLTARQKEALDLIVECIERDGYAPTLDGLAMAMGLAKVTVLAHVRQLEERGYIRRLPYQKRGIELVKGARTNVIPKALRRLREIKANPTPEQIDSVIQYLEAVA